MQPYADCMWHSPFQPDAASDWANFAVGLLTAIATLVAVFVSLQSARRSRADALQARADTTAAQARAAAAEERAVKAAEDQAAASALISATERELELGRRTYQARLETEQKASRHAGSVTVVPMWARAEDEGDLVIRIISSSFHDLSDLLIEWLAPLTKAGDVPAPSLKVRKLPGVSDLFSGARNFYFARPEDVALGSDVQVRLSFTDAFFDRWELQYPSRTLLLLTPRTIDIKPPEGE
jgi:hypothetical protein